jgi:C-terminal processing protease CtpA/Prc
MKVKTILLSLCVLAMLLTACRSAAPTAAPVAQPTDTIAAPAAASLDTSEPEPTAETVTVQADDSGLTSAAIANDEGGAQIVTGEWSYTSYAIATHIIEPVANLVDVSRIVQRNFTEYAPRTAQNLGTLTSPMGSPPVSYQINLPVLPGGASVDLDNDSQQDPGVQIFAPMIGTNLVGDSYLESLEQDGYWSFLMDPQNGNIREGTFLVYAPDNAQGFPASAGADGVYFTADDPTVILPPGYTLATLSPDGKVTFDRSSEAKMDMLEPASLASPDLSAQGLLEGYNSLIDLLKVRYSYTEKRGLDWEEIRAEYLPQIEAADQANDLPAYYAALTNMAWSIHDAHVYVSVNDFLIENALNEAIANKFNGSLGASLVELSDGRFIAAVIAEDSPAAKAGWEFGTEVVSVEGLSISDHINAIPVTDSLSTPESIRLNQTSRALSFPAGTLVKVEYRQPRETQTRSATMTAEEGLYVDLPTPTLSNGDGDIHFTVEKNGFGYVHWPVFNDPGYKLAAWEKFLTIAKKAPGIIIDLRNNGGGNVGLLYTMASYLFTADKPAELHWIDTYSYDEQAGDLVKDFATDYTISAPKPDLAYQGVVVVLVNENTASAAEYMPQFLQRQGRAIIVGEHGTEGAGGVIEQVALSGGITFTFTKGRSYFAGTDELNLEAKGVTLDVRLPITEESLKASLDGGDPVLDAAQQVVADEIYKQAANNLPGTTWQLVYALETTGQTLTPEKPENYTLAFGEGGSLDIKADCNQVNAEYSFGDGNAITIKPGAATLSQCTDDGLGEKLIQFLGAAVSFEPSGQHMLIMLDNASGASILDFTLSK